MQPRFTRRFNNIIICDHRRRTFLPADQKTWSTTAYRKICHSNRWTVLLFHTTVHLYYFGQRLDLTRASWKFFHYYNLSRRRLWKVSVADDNLHGASFRSFESGKIYCGNTRAPSDNLFETVMVILRQMYVSSRNESVCTLHVAAALGRIILCDCICV